MTDLNGNNVAEVVVAGHICLDVIPEVGASAADIKPGVLVEAGPPVFATGGAVANTGLALHRLGVPVRLAGKIGCDVFGDTVLKILGEYNRTLTECMAVSEGESTSYSFIISPPDTDRMFIHSPGCNATFSACDVSDATLAGCKLMHFGYPPLMEAMCNDDGRELQTLFSRAKLLGLATSLDLSMPDMSGHSGRVCWPKLLRNTLPYVDFFLPSFDEVVLMLDREIPSGIKVKGEVSAELVNFLCEWALDAGAAVAGIKAGSNGLYIRTADKDRLTDVRGIKFNSLDDWADRKAFAPCFQARVVGTTGSGDATIAGFIMGLLNGMSLDDVMRAACAVGASSVEAADSVSGIGPWGGILERMQAGWLTVAAKPTTVPLFKDARRLP